jgi:ferritin-like metal-binding protein YciE
VFNRAMNTTARPLILASIAGLLAAAQAVEHYEISRYGTLRTWAQQLGMSDAASLLQETLDEEEATDKTLTKLATSVINLEAEQEQAEAA